MPRFLNSTPSFLIALSVLSFSCSPSKQEGNKDSGVNERKPGTTETTWMDDAEVAEFLRAKVSVRVNGRTNYLTYFENGVPKAKWKVATARPGKQTPRGMFLAHMKEECPPWNNGEGKSAAACAPNNPLGKKAIWWHDNRIYGLHGVDEGNISSVTDANPRSRDQSSGCVRNHPKNIEWLFKRAYVGMPVVVGLWDRDPDVVDCSGKTDCAISGGVAPSDDASLLPKSLPTWCAMNVVEESGRARIRTEANTSSGIVDELGRNAKVNVLAKVEGESVSNSTDWYKVEYTLSGAKKGFIHASLLDCTR